MSLIDTINNIVNKVNSIITSIKNMQIYIGTRDDCSKKTLTGRICRLEKSNFVQLNSDGKIPCEYIDMSCFNLPTNNGNCNNDTWAGDPEEWESKSEEWIGDFSEWSGHDMNLIINENDEWTSEDKSNDPIKKFEWGDKITEW